MLTDPRYGLFAAEVERFVKETATGWVFGRMFGVVLALFVCTAVYFLGYVAYAVTGSMWCSMVAWVIVLALSAWGERRLSQ
jgi:hypothetical protein